MPSTPWLWLARAGAVAAVGLLLTGTAAAPAQADEAPRATAILLTYGIAVGVDESTAGKIAVVSVATRANGGTLPGRVTVRIDAAAAAGTLVVRGAAETCTTAERVTTCDAPLEGTLVPGARFKINLKVAGGARVGDVGLLRLSTSGEGLESTTREASVRVTESGPDLGAAQDFLFTDVVPGDVVEYQPSFRNNGDRIAGLVVLRLQNHSEFDFPQSFSNCRFARRGSGTAFCVFELNLAPGETARVPQESAIRLVARTTLPNRWGSGLAYEAEVVGAPPTGPDWEPGDGPPLRLEKEATGDRSTRAGKGKARAEAPGDRDVAPADSAGVLRIETGRNPADVVALGADASGAVDAVVPIRTGISSDGPALVIGEVGAESTAFDPTWDESDPRQPKVLVTLPEGTTVVGMPQPGPGVDPLCVPMVDGKSKPELVNRPHGLVYRCTNLRELDPDETWFFEFRVKITDGTPATGSVVAEGGGNDPDLENNTAKITLHGGGVGPDPGSGSGGGGGGGDGLPVTGTSVGLLTGVGVLVAAAGVGMYAAARRPRSRFTVAD